MEPKVVKDIQDLRYLDWSHVRHSSGTAGNFLKSQSTIQGEKTYYKLSDFDSEKGIVGHECVNEIIVDRLLDILGVEHLSYTLIHADIEIDGREYDTWLCASQDFKQPGETKTALDNYFQVNRLDGESHYDFCVRNGWQNYVDTMLAVDHLILNRDRHGANIEVLRNARKHSIRIAPLFDHGLSLLCSCHTDAEAEKFDILEDKSCNNFIGGRSTYDNLGLIADKSDIFKGALKADDKKILMAGLQGALSQKYLDKIWEMIWARWCRYEELCNI